GVLGKPRSDPGHAPGQRCRHAVPLGNLLLYRGTTARGRSIARRISERAAARRPRSDHDGDSAGPRVLLRRGLPPAVSRQESGPLLRTRRNRRELPGRRHANDLTLHSRYSPASTNVFAPTSYRGANLSLVTELPIDSYLPAVAAALRRSRAVVVVAPPGAGKTTRVPPALTADGQLILLQPRRVAARTIANRIADEQGGTLGREVGWQVRFERRFTNETKLLVAPEGILTARLQQDPLLSSFRTVVLDEFHERSIHADVGLALAKQAWAARDDLWLVVMSATLDAAPVSRFLDECPVVEVSGRTFPIDVTYHAAQPPAEAARELASRIDG